MTTSSGSDASMVRDLPPHLPLFNVPELEVPKELTLVANLIYEDEVPENLHPALYQMENLPGLFAYATLIKLRLRRGLLKPRNLLSFIFAVPSSDNPLSSHERS